MEKATWYKVVWFGDRGWRSRTFIDFAAAQNYVLKRKLSEGKYGIERWTSELIMGERQG